MSREQLLAVTFVELAKALPDECDVLDFLHNLATRTADLVGADATSVMLADPHGKLHVVASTNHTAEVLGLMTIVAEQGPSVDCFHSGRSVVNVGPLEAERRWPGFMLNATKLGFNAVHVVPLALRGFVVGTLSLLYAQETVLDGDDIAICNGVAAVATIGLLHERTPRQKQVLAEQLQAALNLRVMLEQAKGIVAELAEVTVHDAFALIADYSRTRRQPLGEVADQLVRGTLHLTQLRNQS